MSKFYILEYGGHLALAAAVEFGGEQADSLLWNAGVDGRLAGRNHRILLFGRGFDSKKAADSKGVSRVAEEDHS